VNKRLPRLQPRSSKGEKKHPAIDKPGFKFLEDSLTDGEFSCGLASSRSKLLL
jgi:hypothetical protein